MHLLVLGGDAGRRVGGVVVATVRAAHAELGEGVVEVTDGVVRWGRWTVNLQGDFPSQVKCLIPVIRENKTKYLQRAPAKKKKKKNCIQPFMSL